LDIADSVSEKVQSPQLDFSYPDPAATPAACCVTVMVVVFPAGHVSFFPAAAVAELAFVIVSVDPSAFCPLCPFFAPATFPSSPRAPSSANRSDNPPPAPPPPLCPLR
jgi:hypothetical protein